MATKSKMSLSSAYELAGVQGGLKAIKDAIALEPEAMGISTNKKLRDLLQESIDRIEKVITIERGF